MEHKDPSASDPDDNTPPLTAPDSASPPLTPTASTSGKPYPYDLPEPAVPPVFSEREGQDLPDPPKRRRPRPDPVRTPEEAAADAMFAEKLEARRKEMLVIAADTLAPLPEIMTAREILDWQEATYTLISDQAVAMAGIMASTARLVEQCGRLAVRSGQLQIATEASPAYYGTHTADPVGQQMQSAAASLSAMLSITAPVTNTLMHTSDMLVNDLPQTMAALEEGEVSMKHADIIVKHADQIPRSSRKKFEAVLVPIAKTTNVARLSEKAKAVREKMHPETAIERHKKAVEKRCVRFEANNDGMATLTAYIPAIAAKGIMNRITDTAKSLRSTDRDRTLGQWRADVFQDLLVHGNTTREPYNLGMRARVHVMIDYSTLMRRDDNLGQLDGYGYIDADAARQVADHSPSARRVVVDPASGAVISVGTKRYRGDRASETIPVLAIGPDENPVDLDLANDTVQVDDQETDDIPATTPRPREDDQWTA